MKTSRINKNDHLQLFGDVYEALDACDQLELILNRLHRQYLLDEAEWNAHRTQVEGVRRAVERQLRRPG